jgi:pentapeptide repeat protein
MRLWISGGAHLFGAHLRMANLTGADLTRADLRGANLILADLILADLRHTDLTGAKWPEGAPVPNGWMTDGDTGPLKRAGRLSEVMTHYP